MSEVPEYWAEMYKDRTDERTVEYPWVWDRLKLPHAEWSRVLDVGCCESKLAECLGLTGYHAYGIDIRPYEDPRGFKFEVMDIRKPSFDPEFFDQVVAVSTLEHIGLKTYGNKRLDPNGDHHAIMGIFMILRRGGNFLLTLPFCRALTDTWIRYYKPDSLRRLLQHFKVVELEYYRCLDGKWGPCTQDQAAEMGLREGGYPLGIVLAQLTR